MPPVSRPTVPLPPGSWKVPASLPSARRAVKVIVPPAAGSTTGGGACAIDARGAALPSRNPQEPQKRLEVVLTWLHCGQTTAPTAGAAAGGAATTGAA